MMKVLFTCGGTAGHINPAVALARLFQERRQGTQVLFVGAEGGMETRLVPREGYDLKTVKISSFRRGYSWKSVRYNMKTLRNLNVSRRQAAEILEEFQPDLVVGTGGYASYPVVREAARRKIPTAIHESNAVPGLTTRTLSNYVDCVMVGFEESRSYYRHPERVVVTGTPVRGDFFQYSRKEAKGKMGLTDEKPLLLSYWGSLGASDMNRKMLDFIEKECTEQAPFHHIHGAGGDYKNMLAALTERGLDLQEYPTVQLREYIYDMPLVMSGADLVLCRAGASTLSELLAINRPAVLVPSPNVTNHHQEKNAGVLAKNGGAVLQPEAECTGHSLYELASGLLSDQAARAEMSRALGHLSNPGATELIYETLLHLIG